MSLVVAQRRLLLPATHSHSEPRQSQEAMFAVNFELAVAGLSAAAAAASWGLSLLLLAVLEPVPNPLVKRITVVEHRPGALRSSFESAVPDDRVPLSLTESPQL